MKTLATALPADEEQARIAEAYFGEHVATIASSDDGFSLDTPGHYLAAAIALYEYMKGNSVSRRIAERDLLEVIKQKAIGGSSEVIFDRILSVADTHPRAKVFEYTDSTTMPVNFFRVLARARRHAGRLLENEEMSEAVMS